MQTTKREQAINNRVNVKKLVTMAMMTAISVSLVYLIRFPAFLPFLEYDPADIPIYIATFAYGPVTGLTLTVVVSLVQGLTVSAGSGPIGILMHIFATGFFVLAAGNVYRRNKTRNGALFALVAGTVCMVLAMVVWNVVFTPLYMGAPREEVVKLLVPAIIPFNLMKAGINSTVTFLLYKSISKVLRRFTNMDSEGHADKNGKVS